MMKKLCVLLKLLIVCLTFLLFFSCGSNKYADSFILGDWQWQYPVLDGDGNDISAAYWDAHDAFSYRFEKNGVYIKHGGPDALSSSKYSYEIVGDTLLHLYISSYYFYDESYKITKVSSDTIWLKACPLDKDHDRDLIMPDTKDISFLVKY